MLALLLACCVSSAPPAPPHYDPSASEEQRLSSLMEMGKLVYQFGGNGAMACASCHQEDGKGIPPTFPPLQGQGNLMGDCHQHARIVLTGISGPLDVDGIQYDGVMPGQPSLSDFEIAGVITYERNSWGNDYGICTPEQVKAVRK